MTPTTMNTPLEFYLTCLNLDLRFKKSQAGRRRRGGYAPMTLQKRQPNRNMRHFLQDSKSESLASGSVRILFLVSRKQEPRQGNDRRCEQTILRAILVPISACRYPLAETPEPFSQSSVSFWLGKSSMLHSSTTKPVSFKGTGSVMGDLKKEKLTNVVMDPVEPVEHQHVSKKRIFL